MNLIRIALYRIKFIKLPINKDFLIETMEAKKGAKFNYDDYVYKNDQTVPFVETINERNSKRNCICGNYNESKCFYCFKCH